MSKINVVTHAPHLDKVELQPNDYLSVKTVTQPVFPEANAIEMAENFTKAMLQWSAHGFPVVNKEIYDKRGAICAKCEYWDEKGNLGLGKCKYPKCGCTKMKRWLKTEKCPLDKWQSE